MSNFTYIGADNYGNACIEHADGTRRHITLDAMHAATTTAIAAEDAADESARAYMARGNDADELSAIVSALAAHSARRELAAMLSH